MDTFRVETISLSLEISYTPAVIQGARRLRVNLLRPRLARLNSGWTLDRDMVGALNIRLKALSPGGEMTLVSTGLQGCGLSR